MLRTFTRRWGLAALAAMVCAQSYAPSARADAGDVTIETETHELDDGRTLSIDWGTLEVPANRRKGDSPTITLAFARVRSLAETPVSPIIYLAGGPGGSSTHMARRLSSLRGFAPLIETCDLIFLDQRGTGGSEPNVRVVPEDVPMTLFRSRADAIGAVLDMSAQAKQELAERGVDPAGLDTVQAADDINDLRAALGYERVSLLGFSYGTHLAQATMRRHGEHLDAVVVAGVEGLDQTYKLPLYMDAQFRRLALLAAEDPGVAPHVPDLIALYERVSARLAKEPMIVPARHPVTRERVEVPIGAYGLALIMRFDMGDATDLPVFPKLLHSIDQGDPSVLSWFVSKRLGLVAGLNAMFFYTDAASGASPGRWAMIEDQAARSMFFDVVNFPFPEASEAWDVHDLGDDYRAPLVSDVRTLILSGSLDWNCPPFQAEQLRWGLPNAVHICVENAGHEQILPNREVQDAVIRFLKGEAVTSGTIQTPPLQFVPIEGGGGATHPSVSG